MPVHRVTIPKEVDVGLTQDGRVKFRDKSSGKVLTHYQMEKVMDGDPNLRTYVDALKAWFQTAKDERRRRWDNGKGEPWYQLDVDALLREFQRALNETQSAGSSDGPLN